MPRRDIPMHVRFGVTGHRVLLHPEAIRRRVRDVLRTRIPARFSPGANDTGTCAANVFTILSSLAEGADRLVVKEVLKAAGAELEAVLPLSPEEYERSFASEESKREFRRLRERARRTVVIQPAGSGSSPAEAREQAYEAAGRYVVDHCDLLIAVWDGRPARGRGGTAEIVAYARSSGRPLVIVPPENAKDICIEKGNGKSGRDFNQHGR